MKRRDLATIIASMLTGAVIATAVPAGGAVVSRHCPHCNSPARSAAFAFEKHVKAPLGFARTTSCVVTRNRDEFRCKLQVPSTPPFMAEGLVKIRGNHVTFPWLHEGPSCPASKTAA